LRHVAFCAAYLLSIDRLSADGPAISIFEDRVPLTWAYLGVEPLDIPGHTGLYCDLAGSSQPVERLVPHTEPKPKLFETIFREHATYRFTVVVTGQNVTPVTLRICISWKGDWNIQDVWEETGRI